jgi:branched-chain amino acid transport system ATP-binding protein
MTRLLDLRSISAAYDRVRALQDVSLHVDKGEVIALIGANGAGKSTILRAITGLIRPVAGEIHLESERIDGLRPDQIVRRNVAMVPEGRRIYPLMTVKENLLMGAYKRSDKAGILQDLERLFVRFPRLKERLSQSAGSLSGGEQQMVAIGRALMARPTLLLLDEPSLGLAPQVVREIARTIRDLNREEGMSIILVEQNSRMALKISNRAYGLSTGKIVISGISRDLLSDNRIREIYLGGAV